jgi:DNA polymerase-3 subunit delta
MPLRLDQLPSRLKQGLDPVYLLGGSELLLMQEARDAIFKAAAAEGFGERDLLEARQHFDWDRLGEAAGAPSLFTQRRIVDLRLPTGKPGQDGAKVLREWAESPDPDTLLIVSCDQWEKSQRTSKWAQALDRAGVQVDIWPVKAEEMPAWIAQRLRRVGLEPDREAVMVLAERLEGNLVAAQQEIDKLALVKGAGPVSANDVLLSVADSSRFDAFQLVEEMLAGRAPDALRVAAGLRRMGVAIQAIVGAIAANLKIVEAYRQGMASQGNERAVFQKLRIWQARQAGLRAAGHRMDAKRLAEAWSRLAEIDQVSKGQGAGDAWHQLDQLIVRVCA